MLFSAAALVAAVSLIASPLSPQAFSATDEPAIVSEVTSSATTAPLSDTPERGTVNGEKSDGNVAGEDGNSDGPGAADSGQSSVGGNPADTGTTGEGPGPEGEGNGALGQDTTPGSDQADRSPALKRSAPTPLSTNNFMRLQKVVDMEKLQELEGGDEFEYQIQVSASEQDLVDAKVTDHLPDLTGFPVQEVSVLPTSVPAIVTWFELDAEGNPVEIAQPTVLQDGMYFEVTYQQNLGDGVGMEMGKTSTIQLLVKVPSSFSPLDDRNGEILTNTAEGTSANAAKVQDSADIIVNEKRDVKAKVEKTWQPASQAFSEGATSTIGLKSWNNSNVPVDQLVIEDTPGLVDGATLPENSPFRLVEFQGLGETKMPEGAETVQVDLYVLGPDGKGNWVTGTPAADYQLPVDASDYPNVVGLRFTYESEDGASERDRIQNGSLYAAEVELKVGQRATDRLGGADLSAKTSTTKNVATAQTKLKLDGGTIDSEVVEASAPFEITPPRLEASITKSFSPAEVGKGVGSTGTLVATNEASSVETMTITDNNGFFDGSVADWLVRFDGFTQGVTYPEAAITGKVIYHLTGGGTQEVTFSSGDTPLAPSAGNAAVEGFEFVFASGPGKNEIVGGATTTIEFDVLTNKDANLGEGVADVSEKNEASVKVVAVNKLEADDSDDATLKIVEPNIKLTLNKRIRPGYDVLPGQNVLVELDSRAEPTVNVGVQEIVVTDQATGKDNDFWNAFDMTSIRPTQVPGGYTLKIEYTTDGSSWTEINNLPDLDGNRMLVVEESEFAGLVGSDLGSITGIRFTITADSDNNGGRGNEGVVDFQPNVGFTARDKVRGNNESVPKGDFENAAFADTTGKPSPGGEVNDEDESEGDIGVLPGNPGEPGPVPGTSTWIGKEWNKDWVLSQTGTIRSTQLKWNVASGHNWVTITDPSDPTTAVSGTVFNAFNLTEIDKITVGANPAPYSNPWYLKWDKITEVKLYNGTDWNVVDAPAGSWQDSNRSFKGYKLTAAQQKSTLGIRITVEPDNDAREDTDDPMAPRPGTGVAGGLGQAGQANQTNRIFNLQWQLRDIARDKVDTTDGSQWVTAQRKFNVSDEYGVVRNSVQLGWPENGTANAHDDILIVDPKAGVVVNKTVSKENLVVPEPGAISPDNYPTSSYTITARNNSGGTGDYAGAASRAQWIRVIDPNVGEGNLTLGNTAAHATSNPWSGMDPSLITLDANDPFNRSNITGITLGATYANQIDLNASKVFLLYYDREGSPNFTTGEAASISGSTGKVSLPSGKDWSDVVGFAVVFTSKVDVGASGAGGGGMITSDNNLTVKVDTQVRSTLRDSGVDQKVGVGKSVTTDNKVFAQLMRPEGIDANDKATATGNVKQDLFGEIIDVTPSKDISPEVLYEPTRSDDVTLTLGAKQGPAANASSPWKVVLEDYKDSAGFWNVMNLTSLESITPPTGADRVQIDVHEHGQDDATWTLGEPAEISAAALPTAVALDQVDGLRFTFTKAGDLDENGKGPIFSPTNDPNWSAQVKLKTNMRDTERGNGEATSFPRDPETNTVFAKSYGLNTESSEKKADDQLRFETGSRELLIGKLANEGVRKVSGGSTIPWDIVAKNNGTGYVDLDEIVDTLPVKATYTGTDNKTGPGITYTTLPEGVAEPEATFSTDGRIMTFSWAEGEGRLAPGQQVEIRLWLQLQPGILADEQVTNIVDVTAVQPLSAVGPYMFVAADGDDDLANVGELEEGAHGAESWDHVEIYSGTAIQVYKGVHGPEAGYATGAVYWDTDSNEPDPESTCPSFLGSDGSKYYRTPCVANSQQGETDNWVLRIANAGTTAQFDSFWVIDPLPSAGDLMLVSGDDRGSMFRPALTGMPEIHIHEEAPGWIDLENVLVQVTTYKAGPVCQGAWNKMPWPDDHGLDFKTEGPCTENGETWIDIDLENNTFGAGRTDWENVTGLRVYYHHDDHDTVFHPGDIADLVYTTKNVVKSDLYEDGASNVIPVPRNELAWDQFGIGFRPGKDGGLNDVVAPNKVGTRLLNGSIAVSKDVLGDAAQYAPETLTATVTCEIPGEPEATPLYFADGEGGQADSKTVELTKNPDGDYESERIYGIPLGAECAVQEDGEAGYFGESDRTPISQTLTVRAPDTEFDEEGIPTNPVPEGQISTITNTYNWAGLSVTKNVVTEADKNMFGPFKFKLSCVTSDQSRTDDEGNVIPVPVKFEGGSEKVTFTLKDGEKWTAPPATIPWGSTCTLTEIENGNAGSTVITGSNTDDLGNGTATIKVTGTEEDPAAVVSTDVDNHFPAGTFTVQKAVDGSGAETYGAGPFDFTAKCSYNDDPDLILDEEFSLMRDETKSFGVFPEGTECVVEETGVGGAHDSALDPVDGVITIVGPEEGSDAVVGSVVVTATNTFETGSLEINKIVEGSGAQKYGAGPFTVEAACVYEKDGQMVPVDLPEGGVVELSAAIDYSARFDDIYVGAECSIVETDAGGAHATSISSDGRVVIEEADQVVSVDVTNTFLTGDLEIVKKVNGNGAAELGKGPFEVTVQCESQDVGELELPGGGVYSLSSANDFKVTLEELHADAECVVTETDSGGADSVSMDPANGKITITDGKTKTVTITNTFGQLPKTGASIAGVLIAALALLAAGTLIAVRSGRGKGTRKA